MTRLGTFWRNTWARIVHIVSSRVFGVDLLLAALKFGWATWFLSPWWDIVAQNKAYHAMAFWSSGAWGGLMLVLCLLHLYTILYAKWKLRRRLYLFASGFWMFITWIVASNAIYATTVPTFGILALTNIVLYLWARRS